MGWEVIVALRGYQTHVTPPTETDLGTTRLFVGAPDLTRAAEAALDHFKTHTHVPEEITVTKTMIMRITRTEDCFVVWRAALH